MTVTMNRYHGYRSKFWAVRVRVFFFVLTCGDKMSSLLNAQVSKGSLLNRMPTRRGFETRATYQGRQEG